MRVLVTDNHKTEHDLKPLIDGDFLIYRAGFAADSQVKKQIKEGLVILGNLTIGGTISKVDDLADTLEVCFDAGARTILLPMSSATDISTVPAETFSKFNISFYNDPEDAVRKALEIG